MIFHRTIARVSTSYRRPRKNKIRLLLALLALSAAAGYAFHLLHP